MKESTKLKIDGITISGEFATPRKNIKAPYHTVCICHGVPSGNKPDPSDGGYPVLAEKFRENGFATFIFNFRGTGASEGNFDMLGWTRDLQAVLNHLFSLPVVDKSRLSLLGFSAGAAVSVYVAAHERRVSSIIACACPADFTRIVGAGDLRATIGHFRNIGIIKDKDFPQSIETWRHNFEKVTPVNCVSRIAPRPLLLVHSREDRIVPLEHAHRLYEKAGEPKQLVVLEGDEHRLRRHEKAVAIIIDWLKSRPGEN